jgi:hypothetical protein
MIFAIQSSKDPAFKAKEENEQGHTDSIPFGVTIRLLSLIAVWYRK